MALGSTFWDYIYTTLPSQLNICKYVKGIGKIFQIKKNLQIVSYESDHSNITKLIFLLHEAYFYMTQFQRASKFMVQFDLI